jgi:ATP synthase proteolipid subunit
MFSPQLMSGLGATAAIFFSATGSAIASAQSGVFVIKSSSAGVWSYVPILISGVLAIYGMIIAILIQSRMGDPSLEDEQGTRLLCGGLVVGLGCLSSGFGMSRFLDMYMTRFSNIGNTKRTDSAYSTEASSLMGQDSASIFVPQNTTNLPVSWGVVFTMCFIEAIALYSLIVALFLIG